MAIYIIGDVQGCFASLQRLLELIKFDDKHDVLWFTGDLVNRGPDSLGVLRFVQSLGDKHVSVLGNHDLHLLAVAYGFQALHKEDTLTDILTAHDHDELMHWLLRRPLLHYDARFNAVLTHAGIPPMWSLEKARALAQEVELTLRGEHATLFLAALYGNQPDLWDDALVGHDRLRCIVNYFTRMRLCDAYGRLDFAYKGTLANPPENLYPWFSLPDRKTKHIDIVFGHWAALNGEVAAPHLYALDTGCVYGNKLTAMQLETKERFSVTFSQIP